MLNRSNTVTMFAMKLMKDRRTGEHEVTLVQEKCRCDNRKY